MNSSVKQNGEGHSDFLSQPTDSWSLASTEGGVKYSCLCWSAGRSSELCLRCHLMLFKGEALQTKLLQCQLQLSPGLGNCCFCFRLSSQVLSSRYIAPSVQ